MISVIDRIAAKQIVKEGCYGWRGGRGGKPPRPVIKWRGTTMYAARALYIATHGDIGSLHVLHTCHNDQCTNLDHLYAGTPAQNAMDRDNAGRHHTTGYSAGETHPNAILTDREVEYIRWAVAQGERQRDIAREFQIAESTVSRIVARTAR